MKASIFGLLGLALVSNNSYASRYFHTLLQIREVPPTHEELFNNPPPSKGDEPLAINKSSLNGKVDLDKMIVLGEKLLKLVETGKVVTTINRSTVAVIPQGLNSWSQLAGWSSTPATKVFVMDIRNRVCQPLAQARIKVNFLYGGSYKGKGAYLSNVTMIPTAVYNGTWASTFDIWTEYREPVNIASESDPVAALGFDVRYRFYNWFAESSGAYDAFINAKGDLQLDTSAERNANGGCR